MLVSWVTEAVRVLTTLTRPFSDHLLDIVYRLRFGRHKALPPIDNKLLLLSAVQLAQKIRKRQVSCEEVMRAYVDRSRLVHPLINAVVDERYDAALEDARKLDFILANSDKSEKEIEEDTPLLGVPFTCKEHLGVEGLAQTYGLLRERGRRCPKDCATASLYRRAGAIPYVVTNIPEFCLWYDTANLLFGLTLNPYDNVRSVGGSTGGEAALITSAAGLIGLGNDIGGSIRIPAAFCGIYGHKPTAGLVSNRGSYPDNEKDDVYLVTGPMCRYAADLPLLTKICANGSTKVPWDKKIDFQKVKIYYMEGIPGVLTDTDDVIKKAIRKAVRHFEEEYGVKAEKITVKELRYSFSILECLMMDVNDFAFKEEIFGDSGPVYPYWALLKSLFRCSQFTLPTLYVAITEKRDKDKFYYKCLEMLEVVRGRFKEMFNEDAVLLLPSYPEVPPHYLMTIPKSCGVEYATISNCLGLPSSQVPAGLSRNGLPVGFQVVSGQFMDHLTLAAAVELDKVFNGWISPCPIKV